MGSRRTLKYRILEPYLSVDFAGLRGTQIKAAEFEKLVRMTIESDITDFGDDPQDIAETNIYKLHSKLLEWRHRSTNS